MFVTGSDCTRPFVRTLFAIFTIVFCVYLFILIELIIAIN